MSYNEPTRLIFVNGAPTGAGKTYAICHRTLQLARAGEKILIAQPSCLLIEQTIKEFVGMGCEDVRITAIHGEVPEHSENVVSNIVRHLRDADPEIGEILLVTHAAHQRLPYVHRQSEWNLIYDEAPQAIWCCEKNLPNTHRLITDGFTTRYDRPEYDRVIVEDDAYLRSIVTNGLGDEVYSSFQDIAAHILSPHWAVYVESDQFNNLIEGNSDRRKLILHGILQPSLMTGYKTVLICSADAGEMALTYLWQELGVKFLEDKTLNCHLRYKEHTNGSLITFRCMQEDAWSKRGRDQVVDGRKLLDHMVGALKTAIGGDEFIWLGNTDLKDDLFGDAKAIRLPNSPHGINQYQHVNNTVLLSALNPPPAHFKFLDAMGMPSHAVKIAVMRSAYYQAMGRGGARNPANTTPQNIYVTDFDTADWLASKYPGSHIGSMTGIPRVRKGKPGRKRLHETDAARMAQVREQKRAEWERVIKELNPELRSSADEIMLRIHAERVNCEANSTSCCSANSISYSVFRTPENEPVWGSVYTDFFAKSPISRAEVRDIDSFVELMREIWQGNSASKDSNLPFIPSEMRDGGKSIAHVISSRVLVFDVEDGDLSIEEFLRLLPNLRVLITNSVNHTSSAPRWRAFIFLDYAVNAEIYGLLVSRIVTRFNRAGYWSKEQLVENPKIKDRRCHGFDSAKFHAASLFNLPCQAAVLGNSFFDDYTGGKRAPLNVQSWLRNAIRPKANRPQRALTPDEEDRLDAEILNNLAVEQDSEGDDGEEYTPIYRPSDDEIAEMSSRRDANGLNAIRRKLMEIGMIPRKS